MINHNFYSNYLPVSNGEVLPPYEENLVTNAIQDIYMITGSPLELVLTPVLGAISTIQQGIIKFEDHNGIRHSVGLFQCGTAESGVGKSSPYFHAYREIILSEPELRKSYESRAKEYEVELDVWKKEYNDILKSNESDREFVVHDLTLHSLDKPEKPKKIKFNYGNSTYEAIVEALANNYPYITISSAEGGSELSGRMFKMLAIPNSLWSSEPVTVSRKSTESYEITEASLSINITTQPQVLEKFIEKNGRDATGSGFFARCLFFRTLNPRLENTITESMAEHLPEYRERYRQLIQEAVINFHMNKERKVIKFSPEAILFCRNLEAEIRNETTPTGRFAGAADHAAKLLNNIQRIAANINYFCVGDCEVSVNTLILATQIGAFYSDHYRAMFVKPPQFVQNAILLNEWLNQFRAGQTFIRKNFLLTNGPNALRKSERLNEALDELLKAGVVRLFQDGRTTWVNINPHLYQDILPAELCEQKKQTLTHDKEVRNHGH